MEEHTQEVEVLLQDFTNIFPSELPKGLPPIREIQYHIDLVPGATLPNLSHYKNLLRSVEMIWKDCESIGLKGTNIVASQLGVNLR